MLKKYHLKVAEHFFDNMENAPTPRNRRFWEKWMYESLFAWAGWKE